MIIRVAFQIFVSVALLEASSRLQMAPLVLSFGSALTLYTAWTALRPACACYPPGVLEQLVFWAMGSPRAILSKHEKGTRRDLFNSHGWSTRIHTMRRGCTSTVYLRGTLPYLSLFVHHRNALPPIIAVQVDAVNLQSFPPPHKTAFQSTSPTSLSAPVTLIAHFTWGKCSIPSAARRNI
jgi:hypothetical protein